VQCEKVQEELMYPVSFVSRYHEQNLGLPGLAFCLWNTAVA
jgi:hypothetical protein